MSASHHVAYTGLAAVAIADGTGTRVRHHVGPQDDEPCPCDGCEYRAACATSDPPMECWDFRLYRMQPHERPRALAHGHPTGREPELAEIMDQSRANNGRKSLRRGTQ